MYEHEQATLDAVAKTIAKLKHCDFGGGCDDVHHRPSRAFYVPDDTLMADEATELGIRTEQDFFGGIVPHPFVKTKAITHPLVRDTACQPKGWSNLFAAKTSSVVLPGYTVFSIADAHLAAIRMLPLGPVRLKKPLPCGGGDQTVITTLNELDAFLEIFPAEELSEYGLVFELNLSQVRTLSVGRIVIDHLSITYHGTQNLAVNNEGRSVYGGSDLVCVKGDWDALDRLSMTAEARVAVAQARAYDNAMSTYSGFIASRRNYDVGLGVDYIGQRRSGVFEASWRSGGASTGELAAMVGFTEKPDLEVVEVSTVKEYGRGCRAPPGAVIHYCGNDPRDGPILRYTITRKPDQAGGGFSKSLA